MAWIIQREGNMEIIFIYTWNLHLNENEFDALEDSELCLSFSNHHRGVRKDE